MLASIDRFALLLTVLFIGLTAVVATPFAGLRALPVLLPLAAIFYLQSSRRHRKRRKLARATFPEPWRRVLHNHVAYYQALSPDDKSRFDVEVQWFLNEQHISGPRGVEVQDELRVLVAASAVILTFGRQGYEWRTLRDIVVYPDAFDSEYQLTKREWAGMVHAQGPIILSAKSLKHGFANPRDGHNVGLHEMAHVLDFDSGQADGVPSLMPWGVVEPWVAQMHREIRLVRKHRSVLDSYASKNDAEFFAVATEAFFERPQQLRARHPQLYEMLQATYGQDPAGKGLEKPDDLEP